VHLINPRKPASRPPTSHPSLMSLNRCPKGPRIATSRKMLAFVFALIDYLGSYKNQKDLDSKF
jgi:hypothetical protein